MAEKCFMFPSSKCEWEPIERQFPLIVGGCKERYGWGELCVKNEKRRAPANLSHRQWWVRIHLSARSHTLMAHGLKEEKISTRSPLTAARRRIERNCRGSSEWWSLGLVSFFLAVSDGGREEKVRKKAENRCFLVTFVLSTPSSSPSHGARIGGWGTHVRGLTGHEKWGARRSDYKMTVNSHFIGVASMDWWLDR